jgi:hypothetical protein
MRHASKRAGQSPSGLLTSLHSPQSLDAGCWMLDAGCWMLDAGCWMLWGPPHDTPLRDASSRLSTPSHTSHSTTKQADSPLPASSTVVHNHRAQPLHFKDHVPVASGGKRTSVRSSVLILLRTPQATPEAKALEARLQKRHRRA